MTVAVGGCGRDLSGPQALRERILEDCQLTEAARDRRILRSRWRCSNATHLRAPRARLGLLGIDVDASKANTYPGHFLERDLEEGLPAIVDDLVDVGVVDVLWPARRVRSRRTSNFVGAAEPDPGRSRYDRRDRVPVTITENAPRRNAYRRSRRERPGERPRVRQGVRPRAPFRDDLPCPRRVRRRRARDHRRHPQRSVNQGTRSGQGRPRLVGEQAVRSAISCEYVNWILSHRSSRS